MSLSPQKIVLLICLATVAKGISAQRSFPPQRFTADWNSLKRYQVPDWFRDAKFGIFIHWGPYSVPEAQEWYARRLYEKGTPAYDHHLKVYGRQDTFGYKDLIPLFKGEKYNAAEWITLFKRCGARYIVPAAEHHDGFAMYKTSLTRWNAYNMGPGRDVIQELADETRRQGLKFGISSHFIEHWWFFNTGRAIDSDVNDSTLSDLYGPAMQEKDTMTPAFMNEWLLRSTELVKTYEPDLFWFDWWTGEQPVLQPYLKTFAAYYYNHALDWRKGVVLNYKENSYPEGTAVLDLERYFLDGIRSMPWQTDDALGYRSWSYIKNDQYRAPQRLVDNLVDIVSKNGNLLLNVGPRGDGSIAPEQVALLDSIGDWLRVNGEAIYATRPWQRYGEPLPDTSRPDIKVIKEPVFSARDIRFTSRGDTVYAITLAIPRETVIIRSLSTGAGHGRVKEVTLVGSREKVSWTQKKDGLILKPQQQYPSRYAAVYKILFVE